jgi:hypothetical protein
MSNTIIKKKNFINEQWLNLNSNSFENLFFL